MIFSVIKYLRPTSKTVQILNKVLVRIRIGVEKNPSLSFSLTPILPSSLVPSTPSSVTFLFNLKILKFLLSYNVKQFVSFHFSYIIIHQ